MKAIKETQMKSFSERAKFIPNIANKIPILRRARSRFSFDAPSKKQSLVLIYQSPQGPSLSQAKAP